MSISQGALIVRFEASGPDQEIYAFYNNANPTIRVAVEYNNTANQIQVLAHNGTTELARLNFNTLTGPRNLAVGFDGTGIAASYNNAAAQTASFSTTWALDRFDFDQGSGTLETYAYTLRDDRPADAVLPTLTAGETGAAGHSNYFAVTVDRTQVTGSHSDFVVEIDETALSASQKTALFTTAKTDGSDIRPAADSTGAQLYPFEKLAYNNSTQTFRMKIKLPSATDAVDAAFVLLVGDATLTTPSASSGIGTQALWQDANRFLPLLSSLTDSSGNMADQGTQSATYGANGLIGDGATEYTLDTFPVQSAGTVSMWITPDTVTGNQDYFHSPASNRAILGNRGADSFWRKGNNSGRNVGTVTAGTPVRMTKSWDASNTKYMRNGVVERTVGATDPAFGSGPVVLMGDGSGTAYADGALRDVVVWKTQRSDDWIATEHSNQSNVAAFFSVADMAAIGGGGTTYNETVSDAAAAADTTVNTATLVNVLSDLLTLQDSAVGSLGAQTFNETIADIISASDGATAGAQMFLAATDSVNVGDSVVQAVVWGASAQDVATTADQLSSIAQMASSVTDATTPGDQAASAGGVSNLWVVQSPATSTWTIITNE
jgi:hypothetical protein